MSGITPLNIVYITNPSGKDLTKISLYSSEQKKPYHILVDYGQNRHGLLSLIELGRKGLVKDLISFQLADAIAKTNTESGEPMYWIRTPIVTEECLVDFEPVIKSIALNNGVHIQGNRSNRTRSVSE